MRRADRRTDWRHRRWCAGTRKHDRQPQRRLDFHGRGVMHPARHTMRHGLVVARAPQVECRMAGGAAARRSEHTESERIGGRYVIEGVLGRGGMGSVFRVRDTTSDRRLALKRMAWLDEDGEGDNAQLRFRREFHTMASLKHPRIVEVFDYGVDEDTPYYTLELLDGDDLHHLD